MANYSTLKAAVADVVKTNGTQAITGANLQSVLLSIINSVGGGGYIFKGVATPSTSPGTPDENVFYIGGAGTYANFGTSVTVPVGSIGVFKYNGSWVKEQVALFAGIDDVPTANSNNLVKSGGVYNELQQLTLQASDAEAGVAILDTELHGSNEVTFTSSDYEVIAGLITNEVFRNDGVYGSNNDFILIPFTRYRGRTIYIQPQSPTIYVSFCFLVSDELIDQEPAPLCNGETEHMSFVELTLTVPNDCNYLYIYRRHGQDENHLPSVLKAYAENSEYYTKDEMDNIPVEDSNYPVKSGGLYPIAQKTEQMYSALMVAVWEKQDTSTGIYKPTNQNTGNNGARIWLGNVMAASSATALVTDLIEIDHSKRYKLKTVISNLFDGLAYYNNGSYIGTDVFHSTGDATTVEAELTIPANATHFRLASRDVATAYEISIYKEEVPELAKQADLDVVEGDMEQAQEDIQYLYSVVESSGAADTANAVKNIPNKDLYLGTSILQLTGNTYDTTYWTIQNGVIKYLGGGGTSTPFTFGATTVNGKRYLAELTTYAPDGVYENLFKVQIGSGFLVDTYDGTQNTRGGLVSDGGYFKIVPLSTRAFDMSSVKLSEVLQSDESTGYDRTLRISVENVSAGNSAETLIDGKWNVAIGPTTSTFANNISGSRSIAIGIEALKNFQFGLQNIAIGTFALQKLETGDHNIVIGSDALWQAKKASDNIVIGKAALAKTGEYSEMLRNIAIGYAAMGLQQPNTKDSVSIGYTANMYGISNSVVIGNNAGTTQANQGISNVVCIGYNARATESNSCVLGNANVINFVLGNKKLIFNSDNTVTWQSI